MTLVFSIIKHGLDSIDVMTTSLSIAGLQAGQRSDSNLKRPAGVSSELSQTVFQIRTDPLKRTVAMSPDPLQKKLRLQIRLTAIDEPLYQSWQRWCGDLPFVEVHQDSIFNGSADAIISPANSFGFMDGGIDRLYLERFGQSLQDRVQNQIREDHGGELLVGAATIVKTEDPEFPFLIAAPTMRVPMPVESSINAFLAARAIFLLIRNGVISSGENAGQPVREYVKSITVPGLATGVGRMSPVQCAKQVRAAIEDVLLDRFQFPDSTSQIRKRHDRLLGK